MTISNASEEILVDEIDLKKDSIIVKMPVFEGYIAGTYSDEQRIKGEFIKESLGALCAFYCGIWEYSQSDLNQPMNPAGVECFRHLGSHEFDL